MVPQTPDARAIEKHTRELLQRADARGRFPTPIDDIVAAADLTLPRESLFSGSVLDEAPSHLRRAMKRLTGRVRAVLDRKAREVHVDPSIQNQGRAAFQKLHEVTHDILPWQKELGYADDDATLAATVKELFEQEANIGASNLLFQLDYFDDLVGQYRIGMASILDLALMVGASGHATFRRFVKAHPATVAGVVMELSPCSRNTLGYRRREVIVSAKWGDQFGSAYWPTVLEAAPYSFVTVAEQARVSSEPIPCEFSFPNLRNETVSLNVEVYSNQHALFVLIWKPRRETLRRKRIIVSANIAS